MTSDTPYRPLQLGPIAHAGSVEATAVGGDRLAVAGQDRVTVTAIGDDAGAAPRSHPLDWPVRRLELSHDGRCLLAESAAGDQLDLWDLDRAGRIGRYGVPGSRRAAVSGSFVHGADLVVISPSEYRIEAYDLGTGARRLVADTRRPRGFAIERVVAGLDGDSVFALGHYYSEMRDSLVVLSISEMVADPAAAAAATVARLPFHDYADRLAVGPCGPDGVVVFRDPGESEDPDDDDEDELDDGDELYGYRGLYVRRLGDGRIAERIPYDGPVVTGDLLLGTPDVVAVGSRSQLDIVPRRTSSVAAAMIPAASIALDAVRRRVAYVEPSGAARIIEL